MIVVRFKTGGMLTGRLDIGAAVRLRSVGIDVLDPDLELQPAACVNALYVILRPSMGELDFAAGLESDPVEVMREALSDFYQCDVSSEGDGGKANAAELWSAVWRAAGVAGVDPHGLTFGELMAMAEGRQRHEWDMQSALMSLTHNIHAKNDRPPAYFNPFSRQRSRVDVMTTPIADLAETMGAKPWRVNDGVS
jgi:hypothetical protein